jgi:hypothetical protein
VAPPEATPAEEPSADADVEDAAVEAAFFDEVEEETRSDAADEDRDGTEARLEDAAAGEPR